MVYLLILDKHDRIELKDCSICDIYPKNWILRCLFFFFDGKSRHYHAKLSTFAIRKIWDYFCTVNSRHHELIIDLFDIMIALLLLLVLLLSAKASRTIVILYNSVAVCKILTLNSQMSFINLSILSLLCMCITMKLNGSLYM